MVTEVIAAVLVVLVVVPLARHMARQQVTRGWFLNMFEAMRCSFGTMWPGRRSGARGRSISALLLDGVFLRAVQQSVGDGSRVASATGNINVTAALALMTLGTVLLRGCGRWAWRVSGWGSCRTWMSPCWLKPFLWGLMFVIEVSGLLIRHVVLAVRLFANMFAGHMVLAVILGFILMAWESKRVLSGDAGERHGRGPAEPAGVVRGVPASVHLYFSVRAVYRCGDASALSSRRRRSGPACALVSAAWRLVPGGAARRSRGVPSRV